MIFQAKGGLVVAFLKANPSFGIFTRPKSPGHNLLGSPHFALSRQDAGEAGDDVNRVDDVVWLVAWLVCWSFFVWLVCCLVGWFGCLRSLLAVSLLAFMQTHLKGDLRHRC